MIKNKIPLQKKLNNIFDEDFRLLIAGESGCGKNQYTHAYSSENHSFITIKIYIYSPNLHQEKIQDFKEIMDSISEKVGYSILEIDGPEEIKNTNEYFSNNRKIVVFDDVINAPEKIQNKIANHWTDGRHHGISPIYLSQSYYDTPQKIKVKLFKYDSLSTKHKKSFESYCKRKLD